VAELAKRHGERLRSGKEHAVSATVRIEGKRVALAFPMTYMNDSGRAARALVRRYNVTDLTHLVVVHDEIDLPVGRLQLKYAGGLAGHNGLKSIRDHLHTSDFVRVRIGVGRPPGRQEGADHVLSKPGKSENILIDEAADAVEAIITDGLDAAMNQYNRT
jgi:PTH1 family peptidyl-tRNA hydrolase